jgi:hypothetical protein
MKFKLIILSIALITINAFAEDAIKEVDRTPEATRYAEGECIQELKDYFLSMITKTDLINKYRYISVQAIEDLEQDMEKNGDKILNNATAAERGLAVYKDCIRAVTSKVLETKNFKK